MDGNIEKMQSLTGRIKGLGIDKTLTKKGMCAEAEATGKALATKVNITDIVDDLTSVADDKPLSANQGRVLKKQIDEIDPHYAENVIYGDTNVKDAIDKLSKAENIAYDEEKSVQGAIDEVSRTLGYTKSYNLLPYNKVAGSWNGITTTPVLDSNGLLAYYSISGSRTSETYYNVYDSLNKSSVFPNGIETGKTYKVSANSTNSLIKIAIFEFINGAYSMTVLTDTVAEWTPNANTTRLEVRIAVDSSAKNLSDVRIYPMIRPSDIEDDTYEPYVPSIGEIVVNDSITATATATYPTTIKTYSNLPKGKYIMTFRALGTSNTYLIAQIKKNGVELDAGISYINVAGISVQVNISSIFEIQNNTDAIELIVQSGVALTNRAGQNIRIMRIA